LCRNASLSAALSAALRHGLWLTWGLLTHGLLVRVARGNFVRSGRRAMERRLVLAHEKSDPLSLQVDLYHADFHNIAGLHQGARIFHEMVGQLRHVNEPVLMHTYIDESTEVRDTRDRAFKYHAGLQVLDVVDPFGERRSFELGAGSQPGFASSSKISHTVGKPKRSSTNWEGSSDFKVATSPMRERTSRLLVATILRASP